MRPRSLLVAASILVFTFACAPAPDPGPDGSFLSEGDQAPDFALPSAGGGEVTLGDFANQKRVLLYFSMGPG